MRIACEGGSIAKLGRGSRSGPHEDVETPDVGDGEALKNFKDGRDEAEEEDEREDGAADVGEGHWHSSRYTRALLSISWRGGENREPVSE